MKYWRVNKMEIKNWKEIYSKAKEVSEKAACKTPSDKRVDSLMALLRLTKSLL